MVINKRNGMEYFFLDYTLFVTYKMKMKIFLRHCLQSEHFLKNIYAIIGDFDDIYGNRIFLLCKIDVLTLSAF